MSKTTAILPISRTWRDIPQQVKPRAMSREGKRRSALRGMRMAGGMMAVLIALAAAWEVVTVLRPNLGAPKLAAPQEPPIGDNIEPITNGVLDKAWLRRTLALPASATLASIDPAALRLKVLAGGQVQAVDIVRHYPRTLAVHMAERTPVARLMAQGASGKPREYLVARDGVVYAGQGYDPEMTKTLLWLDGVHPQPGGPGVASIAHLEQVSTFLADSNLLVPGLYRTWRVVSLAQLESDGLLEVRTAAGTRIIFNLRDESLLKQVARLDYALEQMASAVPAGAISKVDLSLGPKVVAEFAPLAQQIAAAAANPVPASRNVRTVPDASGPAALPAALHFHIYP